MFVRQESDADEDEETDIPKSGSWKPQVHFVWDMLLDQVLPAPSNAKGTVERSPKGSFPEFFRIVVDGLSPFRATPQLPSRAIVLRQG